ncbi:prolyl-tRNA synthetase [Cavenderia fasciculata]|uniref:proline--tRNA ligase n=1 Tax=Cavenderia fasciculata TaxID=261658 RepID=F4PGV1_CACFS|nr:prolyl-tRNA synthetase [Cavenderia fasciculata]EGG24935.1 prolyl-tRNA synthetase [Cavenderia fasciculata]|eukprot:XP_004362786.1 prolyl-tRNA synthetase [Cavenderia fasciculata]
MLLFKTTFASSQYSITDCFISKQKHIYYIIILSSTTTTTTMSESNTNTNEVTATPVAAAATPVVAAGGDAAPKREKREKKEKKEKKEVVAKPISGKEAKDKLNGAGVAKEEDFSEWYTNVITRAEMVDYYDVSGCYILRPWSYSIWEQIQGFFDGEIKKLGVQNAYFPLFVSEKALATEEDHIEGFAPEVAWVTKSGQSELSEPIAIRPTSETIMYPAYANWIRSHRDLPLKLNQWVNVVRWEFKRPVPFLRSREFLWQEGHTVYATKEEADKEVFNILRLYKRVYEDLLAVPVVEGIKSEKEKFAGGLYTSTIEGFIPSNGRAIQAATSHALGQNFSKMFNIEFENTDGKKALAWQNSWGLTTRSIGVMVMVHGDDNGLVLPPRIAPIQVVILPFYFKDTSSEEIDNKAAEVLALLQAAGIRAQVDNRTGYSPRDKHVHWELKGVPIRIEIGPKDLVNKVVVFCRRDVPGKEGKFSVPEEGLALKTKAVLDEIQANLLARATKTRNDNVSVITKWEEFIPELDKKHIVLAPWCEAPACEENIKKVSNEESLKNAKNKAESEKGFCLTGAAKSLCIPLNVEDVDKKVPALTGETQCFGCGCESKATKWTLFGRSY